MGQQRFQTGLLPVIVSLSLGCYLSLLENIGRTAISMTQFMTKDQSKPFGGHLRTPGEPPIHVHRNNAIIPHTVGIDHGVCPIVVDLQSLIALLRKRQIKPVCGIREFRLA